VNRENLKFRKEAAGNQTDSLNEQDGTTIRRQAISQTCIAFGFLVIRTGRISSPIMKAIVDGA